LKAGGKLPADKDPSKDYLGEKYITCTPILTMSNPGEPIKIKAIIMGEVHDPTLFYRRLGSSSFNAIGLKHEARGVYRVTIPGQQEDFEWYITAETNLGRVVFPATADAKESEKMYQTVIVL